jgi:hypothetical protein
MNKRLTLDEEREFYAKNWETVLQKAKDGILDREEISQVMLNLNIIDSKIMKEKEKNAQKNYEEMRRRAKQGCQALCS